MFLKKTKNKDRIYLSYIHSYREGKKIKQVTIKKLGYVDDLMATYDDPIKYFTDNLKKFEKELMPELDNVTIELSRTKDIGFDTNRFFNFGYAPLKQIYNDLGLYDYFVKYQKKSNSKYTINEIIKLLVFSRIIYPGSKNENFSKKDRFFERFNFEVHDIYRCLSEVSDLSQEIQSVINKSIKSKYGRDNNLAYYDCTNYYFEINQEDELRRKGPSKEKRKTPIVQMGLLMDSNGFPISYNIFPGNESEKLSLVPEVKRLRKNNGIDKIIVVADRGLNTSDNIYQLVGKRDGYVYSQTIRGSSNKFKDYVLDESGYVITESGFKYKERVEKKYINYTDTNGEKKRASVPQKQIVFYSPDYDKRAKALRYEAIKKAESYVKSPGKYKSSKGYGAAKFVNETNYNDITGEVLEQFLELDLDKITEEEKFDGYYSIVTSEIKKSSEEIIEIYRGLWRIEESFKITKSEFKARPVYLSREERINSHFLTCFIALAIMRVLEYELGRKHAVSSIIEAMRECILINVNNNNYIPGNRNIIMDEIGQKYGINFNRQVYTRQDIKIILKN